MAEFHILIVDDQRDIRFMFAAALQTLGQDLAIVDVPSAEEAMLVASRRVFDLIITDVNLPGISGLDLVKRIQKRSPNLKIILVTGVSDYKMRRQVEEAGVVAVFYKPVELEDFLATVRSCLGIGQAKAQAGPKPEAKAETRPEPPPEIQKPKPATVQTPALVEKPLPVVEKPDIVAPSPNQQAVILSTLRERLNANVVILMDHTGKVLLQAGDSEMLSRSTLLTSLAAIQATGLQISQMLGSAVGGNLLFIPGLHENLCLVAAPQGRGLLAISEQPYQGRRLGEVERLVRTAIEDLSQHWQEEEPAPAPPPVVEPVPVVELVPLEEQILAEIAEVEVTAADQAAIDDLFKKTSSKKKKTADLNAFWDIALEESSDLNSGDNKFISFDEAKDMGLAPE